MKTAMPAILETGSHWSDSTANIFLHCLIDICGQVAVQFEGKNSAAGLLENPSA